MLLADEPTGALDSQTSRRMFSLFSSLAHDHGMCVVIATHDPIVTEYCDEMTLLRDGMVTP